MKRLVTTSIFGTILGIIGAYSTANASIVSSGFLDEKLTEYALSTSLDLKANQTDLTALSNKIGTLPSVILPSAWTDIPYYTEFGVNMPDGIPLPPLGEQLELLFNGGIDSPIDRMFRVITLAGNAYPVGTMDPGSNDPQAEFLGLNPLTQKVRSIDAKIGTVPDGKNLAGMISETDAKIGTLPSGDFPLFLGHEFLFSEFGQPLTYPTSLAELITAIYGYGDGKTKKPGFLEGIFAGFPFDSDQDGRIDAPLGLMPNYQLAKSARDIADANAAKIGAVPDGKNLAGMISETDAKIGTLPTGTPNILTVSTEYINASLNLNYKINYPKSLSDLIVDLYGTTDPSNPGLLSLFTTVIADLVLSHRDALNGSSGLLKRMDNVETKIGKIGTLPTEIPNEDPIWSRYGFLETTGTPIILPDTIGEVLTVLFNEDASYKGLSLRNIMAKILLGFDTYDRRVEGLEQLTSAYNLTGDSPIVTAIKAHTAKIGTVPDGKNLAGMISETDAKIGTLPAGYDSVGAALSAIKGIAEEAKTAALAAIPDPKQEGSSGKYVLTVDIIGDNATYHWEKIDREGEATTTE